MPNQNFENKISKTSLKDKVKKGVSKALLPFVVAGSVLGASGCATTGGYAESNSNIGYEKFYDSYGDYKLVQKNNDVWMEKLDGSEAPKQITHTPDKLESIAFFSVNSKYIFYSENKTPNYIIGEGPHYLIPMGLNDERKKEIGREEMIHHWEERDAVPEAIE